MTIYIIAITIFVGFHLKKTDGHLLMQEALRKYTVNFRLQLMFKVYFMKTTQTMTPKDLTDISLNLKQELKNIRLK